MKIKSLNPAKGFEVIDEVEEATKEQIVENFNQAKSVQKEWKNLGLLKRIELMRDLADCFKNNSDKIASLISLEMGKPITQSKQEISRALDYLQWDFANAEKYLEPEITYEDETTINKVFYEPKGTVLCIQPFNFPFSQFIWQTMQNLIVGNVVISKPDINSPLTAKLIAEIIDNSKLPKGVLQIVIGGIEIGQFLVSQNFDLILFTGSTKTGEYINKTAAEKMISAHLELGGSSPAIVCDDADIEAAAKKIFANRFRNCGQVCDAIKRIIVHKSKVDELIKYLIVEADKQIIGDPMNEQTNIGPLVNQKQLDKLIEQVKDAIDKGATIICGGKQPENLKGSFYEPTILTNITRNMRVWQEEVFGPVCPIITFETIEEAIELGNDTIYGLSASVFTKDKVNYEKIYSKLDTGMIAINDKNYGGAYNPFGGVKASGNSRVLGKYGFHELCNIKLITFEK